VPFRKRESALLALGILLVIIGSVLLAWNILADPYVLTVFDGQWASITREGKEFKFMYDANSSWITQTWDLGGSSGFLADTGGTFWLSWENGTHIYCIAELCLLTRTLFYYCLPMAQAKPLLILGP
jgi:hypothetical protein